MSGVSPGSETELIHQARERTRRLALILCAAGLVSLFRAAALIVTTTDNTFWPVAVALAVLFPGCCGVAYCVLAARIARGSQSDLVVSVTLSAILFVPYLLLSPFEEERAWPYTEAISTVPTGPLLDRVLYWAQMTAITVHSVLLGWVVVAGRRLLRSWAGTDAPPEHPPRPSLWANLLLVFVGVALGYGWNIWWILMADLVGLRGQQARTEWGPASGSNDVLISALTSLLLAVVLVGWQFRSRWRCWGLVTGALAGMALALVYLR